MSHDLDRPEVENSVVAAATGITADITESSSSGVTTSSESSPKIARSEVIGQDLRSLSVWSLRLIFVAGAIFILYKLVGFLWVGILPTILAIIVCSALWPPVHWLIRHKVPSWLASLGTLLVCVGMIAGVLSAIAPTISREIGPLSQKTVDAIFRLRDWLMGPPLNINQHQLDVVTQKVTEKVQASATQIASYAINGVGAASSALVTLVITFMLCFFFLKDGQRLLPLVRRVVGEPAASHLSEVSTRAWGTLGGFIRAQGIVSLIDAVFIGIGMFALGVPLAGPLMVITFMGGFIPIVGAFVSGVLAVLFATVGISFKAGLIMLAIILVVQQLEGNVLSPILQSNAMDLHPVIVLLVVAAGGTLKGIVGAFLAVPVTAVLAVICRYIVEQWDVRAHVDHPAPPEEDKKPSWIARLFSSIAAKIRGAVKRDSTDNSEKDKDSALESAAKTAEA